MRAVEKLRANKLRARRWRKANPEKVRANAARYLAAHPMTPERRARKVANAKAWREKNLAHVKREQAKRWLKSRDEINARRRAKHAADPAKEIARQAAWKAAHPGHNRAFYYRHREKFTGDGPWSMRAKRLKRAWRKFVHTGAVNRANNQQGQSQC